MKQHFLILLLIAGLFSCNTKTKPEVQSRVSIPDSFSIIIIKGDSNIPVRSIGLPYATTTQVTQIKNDLTKLISDQGKKVDAATAQAKAANDAVTALTKTVTALKVQLKNYSIDSAATKKRLTDAETKLFTVDTTVKSMVIALVNMANQNHDFYTRSDIYNQYVKANNIQQDSLIRLTNRIIVYPDSLIFSLRNNQLTITKWQALIDALKKIGITL